MRTLGVSQPLTIVVLAVVLTFGAVVALPFNAADARHYFRHGQAAECGPASTAPKVALILH